MTRRAILFVLAAGSAGCADRMRTPVVPTGAPEFLAVPIACRVDAAGGTGACIAGAAERGADAAVVRGLATGRLERIALPDPHGLVADAILGGQAASLAVSSIARETGAGPAVFSMRVTLANLLDQAMGLGVPDASGEVPDTTGVRLFVEQGPIGEGAMGATAEWLNPDLVGATGSAPGQSAMRYPSPIVAGGSASREWRVRIGSGATAFSFRAVVVARLADEGVGARSAATVGVASVSLAGNLPGLGACALSTSQRVYCWGQDVGGGFGSGTTLLGAGILPTPTEAPLAGAAYALRNDSLPVLCAVRPDGSVRCRGTIVGRYTNTYPQIDGGEAILPTPTPLVSLTMARSAMCGLDATGGAWCFGATDGPTGTFSDGGYGSAAFARVAGTTRFSALAGGDAFMCGLSTAGRPWCWGSNERGQLGTPLPGSAMWRAVPVAVRDSARTYGAIAASRGAACALDTSGVPWCWGDTAYGQLGVGDTVTNTPFRAVRVQGLGGTPLTSLTAGGYGFCGLTASGALWCWGLNTYGMLGDDLAPRWVATPVQAGRAFTAVALSTHSMCGIQRGGASSGRVACWGVAVGGILGQPASTAYTDPFAVLTPRDVPGLAPSQVDRLAMSGDATFATACAWKEADRRIWCWGHNEAEGAALVPGIAARQVLAPVGVPTGRRFTQVSIGGQTTCGIESGTSALFCWGRVPDESGTMSDAPMRVPIPGNRTVLQVALGGGHGCALATAGVNDRKLYCWGSNSDGQLGDNTTTTRATPTLVNGGTKWDLVTVGSKHSCAVESATRAVWCWGSNADGQLGLAGTAGARTPAPLGIVADTVVTGSIHTCALSGGTVSCWGANTYGALGRAGGAALTPEAVPDVSGAASLAAGGSSTCALGGDGLVTCWGRVKSAAFAFSFGSTATPAVVATGIRGGRIAVADGTYCDVTADGRARCAGAFPGNGTEFQYGGTFVPLRLPVAGVP